MRLKIHLRCDSTGSHMLICLLLELLIMIRLPTLIFANRVTGSGYLISSDYLGGSRRT